MAGLDLAKEFSRECGDDAEERVGDGHAQDVDQ